MDNSELHGSQCDIFNLGFITFDCRMTNYELLRWLVETPSRDVDIIICSPLHGHPGWHYNVTPGDVMWRSLNANVRYILRCFCLRFACFFIFLESYLRPRVTFSTSGSSYFHVPLTTVRHLLNVALAITCIICILSHDQPRAASLIGRNVCHVTFIIFGRCPVDRGAFISR